MSIGFKPTRLRQMCNSCFKFSFCVCSDDCVVLSVLGVLLFLFVFGLSFMLSPSMIAWLMVRGVESGLSCDIFRDVFVALSLDVFSISVFMLLILCAIEVMFFVVVVSLVSISWMWLFVLSDCVENSVWFDSSDFSLLSIFDTLRLFRW